jgi:hypothetical protein
LAPARGIFSNGTTHLRCRYYSRNASAFAAALYYCSRDTPTFIFAGLRLFILLRKHIRVPPRYTTEHDAYALAPENASELTGLAYAPFDHFTPPHTAI